MPQPAAEAPLLGSDPSGASQAAQAQLAAAKPKVLEAAIAAAEAHEEARARAGVGLAGDELYRSQEESLAKIRRENGACCSACVPSVIRVTWQLQVIGFFTALHASIDGDLSTPYYWSRVSCCGALGSPANLSAQYDVTCENPPDNCLTAVYDPALDQPGDRIGACELPDLERANPLWSHSNHCVNWDFVRFFVQRFVGTRSPIVTVVSCLMLPVGAGLADMYGRRPVIIFGAVATILQLGLYWIGSLPRVIEADRFGLVVYTGGIVNALGASTGSASNAMLADLVQPADRAKGFPLLAMVSGVGPILGYAIAFTLLSMYIADYQWVWLTATSSGLLLLLFNVVLLPESLPASMRKPFAWRDLNPLLFYARAFRLLLPDRVILGLCTTAWLIGIGIGGFLAVVYAQLLVGPLALTQEIAILPGVVGALTTVICSCCAIGLNHRIGMWRAFVLGMCMNVLGFTAYGAWPMLFIEFGSGTAAENLAIARVGPFIFGPLLSAGGAIATPAYLTIISGRVANNNQAKAQSLISFFLSIGVAIGTVVYSTLLFDPGATGQYAVRFCYVTAGIYVLATCIVLCTAWSDESNHAELRCCCCCRARALAHGKASADLAPTRAEARRPSVQGVASMPPSISSEFRSSADRGVASRVTEGEGE